MKDFSPPKGFNINIKDIDTNIDQTLQPKKKKIHFLRKSRELQLNCYRQLKNENKKQKGSLKELKFCVHKFPENQVLNSENHSERKYEEAEEEDREST